MRILRVIGEGALIGVLVGLALAAARIHAHADLRHGATLLPLLRVAEATLGGAGVGVSVSLALAVVFSLAGRAIPPRRTALALAALGIGGAIAAAAWPYSRAWLRSLVAGEISWPAIFSGVVAVAAAALLLALRARDALGGSSPSAWEARARAAAAILGLAGLAVVLVGSLALRRAAAARAEGHPSVVLISLDTLRADRLGVLGYPRLLTPHLDRLAREGALFAAARSPAPWTKPAHASLFLSLLPFDHGARWNRTPIRAHRALLAERFRDAGYRTAAFTGGASVHGDAGFDQGFEIYENHNEIAAGGAEPHMERALDWVCDLGGAPFFLFLHTYEVHVPYTHRDFADPADAGRIEDDLDYTDLEQIRQGELVPSDHERRFVADLYDGDVAHADALVGRLLDGLEACGGLENSIVVVFSDHGEDLWDHVPSRSPDHGHSLYEELVHVCLIFWQPGVVRADSTLRTPVSLLDVAPTLLALAGLPPDPGHRGLDLAPALREGSEPPGRPIFSESVEYGPDRFAVRDGDLKVIVAPFPEHSPHAALEVAPLEVFDLARDPHEQHNLADRLDAAAHDLARSVARRAFQKLRRPGGSSPALDAWIAPYRQEQLRALGYAE